MGALKKRFGGNYRCDITMFCFRSMLVYIYSYYSFCNRRGAAPERHQDAAGGLIRSILITLDDLKITEKTEKGGRRISRIGQQALDLVAGQVARGEV